MLKLLYPFISILHTLVVASDYGDVNFVTSCKDDITDDFNRGVLILVQEFSYPTWEFTSDDSLQKAREY